MLMQITLASIAQYIVAIAAVLQCAQFAYESVAITAGPLQILTIAIGSSIPKDKEIISHSG